MGIEIDLRVGDWVVQPQLNRIVGRGGEHQVEPKVMEVLLVLARQPGAVVSRDELLSEVWPDTVVVETAVFRAISELRRILNDDPKNPRVIETVRKRGYRLIAPVDGAREQPGQAEGSSRDLSASMVVAPPRWRSGSWRVAALATLSLGLAVMMAISFRAVDVNAPTRAPSWPAPPTVVASSMDLEVAPALSPDGKGLAYVRGRFATGAGEPWKIYVKLPEESAPRLLSPGLASEGFPAWSPDGGSIAFWRDGKKGDELAVVPILGGPAQILFRTRSRVGPGVSWSADGSWLVAAWRIANGGPMAVHRIGQDGAVTALTRPPDGWFGDISPAVSPDGERVAFIRSSTQGREHDVYLVSAAGGEPRRLTYDHKPIRGLAWRRDGKQLVFASKRSHQFALWQVSIETGELTWTGVAEARSPSFARDVDTLVYEHVEREINIWQADVATGRVRSEPLIRSTWHDRAPHFRADGKAIAFSSERTGHFEIWASDPDGANPRQLTAFKQFVSRPRWSPDGRRLAFEGDVDGNHDVYVVDAPGYPPRRLTHHSATDGSPSWSPDGRWVYFSSIRTGVWQIWKMASGGGKPVQVTRTGGFTAHASGDDRWLYVSGAPRGGLWRLPVTGGAAERVLERFFHPMLNGWDVIGDRVIYAQPRRDRSSVIAYDPEQQTSTTLIELPHGARYELAFSEDLTSVLFTQMDRRASDIYQVQLSEP